MNEEIDDQGIDTGMCPHGNFPQSCATCAERNKRWAEIQVEIESIADRNGKGLDAGIKESIIALKASEFPTEQSCEGHINEGALPYPWVRIGVDIPKEEFEKFPEETTIEQARGLLATYVEENKQIREKLVPLVEEFNEGREVDPRLKLEAAVFNIYDHSIIQPIGAEALEAIADKTEREHLLELSRKEMNDFSEFLKKRFFAS